MKCPNPKCGAILDADAVFCGNCGERVAPSAQTQAPATEPGAQGTKMWEPQATGVVLEQGSVFAKRYDIERMIGAGGMGSVYLARDQNTLERVALKLLHRDLFKGPTAMARLAAEGVTARQIRHPNIVAVYDVAQDNGQPYMSMEYVAGGSLRSWLGNVIRARKDVPVATAAGIIKAILSGLAEAHRMQVIHRDLKPENVLLQGDPLAGDFRLKILDFGIAKVTTVSAGTGSQSSTGRALGTPLYMAPEQHTAPDTVGPPADLYSVSVMLYELLMETPPQGNSEMPSLSRKDVPKALDEVISRGMKQRPRDRFQSAEEYATAMDAAVAIEPQSEPRGTWEKPLPGGAGQHRPLPGGDGDTPKPEPKVLPVKPGPPVIAPTPGRNKLYWAIGAAVLVVGGLISNYLERPRPEKPEVPRVVDPVKETSPPPPPPPTRFNASGIWNTYINGIRYSYSVQHDGTRFSLTGQNGDPFWARGTLTKTQCIFDWGNPGRGDTGVGQCRANDEHHISYTASSGGRVLISGCFKVNHDDGPNGCGD